MTDKLVNGHHNPFHEGMCDTLCQLHDELDDVEWEVRKQSFDAGREAEKRLDSMVKNFEAQEKQRAFKRAFPGFQALEGHVVELIQQIGKYSYRTYDEQKRLHEKWLAKRPAAQPGLEHHDTAGY